MALLAHLNNLHSSLPTPALCIDASQMQENLFVMQKHADAYHVKLRPHCKTHKSPDLAKQQLKLGASGITVAKLSEAEVMAEAGIEDIFIANEITQTLKMQRLHALHEKIDLIIGIDDVQQLSFFENEFKNCAKPLQVRLEIDCGFGRCGLMPQDWKMLDVAKNISDKAWLNLEGVFTHGGHAYGAATPQEIRNIARQEAGAVLQAKKILKQNGIEVATISVGSTPTAREVIMIPGISEARPGNYIFYDGIQNGLGVCTIEQCSLTVLATVISRPAPGKIIIDAGSKALNLDKGAHSTQVVNGYGTLLNIAGIIERLSEEHGIIRLNSDEYIPVGSPVVIIPNHACTVANLFNNYYLIQPDGSYDIVPIQARGKSQ